MKKLLGIFGIFFMYSCVPLKQQMFLTDQKILTYYGRQRLDTVVRAQPYRYKIRKGDEIGINISTFTRSESTFVRVQPTEELPTTLKVKLPALMLGVTTMLVAVDPVFQV